MKRAIYIILIIVISIACNHQKSHVNYNHVDSNNNDNYEKQFSDWLNQYKLKKSDFVDTTSIKVKGLFEYWLELYERDSQLLWYPTKDSSYYLLTNYNKQSKKRLDSDDFRIKLTFLDIKTNKISGGMYLLDSNITREIDYYWYDFNTFYFLEDSSILSKIKMGVDSLWTYKIKHNIE